MSLEEAIRALEVLAVLHQQSETFRDHTIRTQIEKRIANLLELLI